MPPVTTHFMSTGSSIQVDRFDPVGTRNGGAIIVAHGSDGIVDNSNGAWKTMMTDYAADLAGKGFVVLMPYYFGNAQSVDFLQLPRYAAALADAIVVAKALPGIDAARLGLLGFSLGGHLCLRNRSSAKVLVEFFAPELPELGGIGAAGNPKLHAQIHHGENDRLVPLDSNAKPIQQALGKEGADVTLFGYEHAGHGFSGKDSGDASAQTKSRARALTFFIANL